MGIAGTPEQALIYLNRIGLIFICPARNARRQLDRHRQIRRPRSPQPSRLAGAPENIEAMDSDQQVRLIQDRLDALEGMPVSDDQSAREAFAHVMVTVSRINEVSTKARAQAMMGAGGPEDEILEKLREWLDRLVGALPRIVENLVGATFVLDLGRRQRGRHRGLRPFRRQFG